MGPASTAFAAACVLLVVAPASGQALAPTAPPIAIININLIRMRGDVIEPRSAVVVQDGRIRDAGRMNDLRIPEGATVIDGAGGYLLPGLDRCTRAPRHRYAVGRRASRLRGRAGASGASCWHRPSTPLAISSTSRA